jgi:CBS domain-containing protein
VKVSSILEKKGNNCVRIDENSSLLEASEIMCQHKIGSLMVFDVDKVKSIVTERDIMTAVSKKLDLANTTVSSVMPKSLITCSKEHLLEEVMTLMVHNDSGHSIRHLPVIDENSQFMGIVSIIDVIELLLTETQFENQILKNYIKKWPDEASG